MHSKHRASSPLQIRSTFRKSFLESNLQPSLGGPWNSFSTSRQSPLRSQIDFTLNGHDGAACVSPHLSVVRLAEQHTRNHV